MSSIKRFAIQHPYSDVAETQSCARIIASAKKLELEDHKFGARKLDTEIGFYANTVSSLETASTTNFRVPFLHDNCEISESIVSSTGTVIDTVWDAQARQISNNPDLESHALAEYDKIWFYGASLNGALTLKVLTEKLGMKLAGVADTYNTGIWEGFEILSPEGLLEIISKSDVLVITSMHWLTIGEELKKLGIPCDVFIFNNENTLRLIL